MARAITAVLVLRHSVENRSKDGCFDFRAEYECFQIELAKNYGVPEWREDLKKVLLKSGVENKSMVFLFSDTQVSIRRKLTTSMY